MIIGSNIIFAENLTSTNTHAFSLLKNSLLPEGTVIHTNFQAAGRGQAGNSWESEDGKNLLFSIILYPSTLNPADQFYLSMSVSLGICDFLDGFFPGSKIKWPNDIYVNNDKIAGILIESAILSDTISHSVAGIGLNVNQVKFFSDAPNPVSISMLTGHACDLSKCLSMLLDALDKRYKELITGNLEDLKTRYISRLFRYNEWSYFSDSEGRFKGRIAGIGDYGFIRIEKTGGEISEYGFKEVEFIL